jgi:hypothetical protein
MIIESMPDTEYHGRTECVGSTTAKLGLISRRLLGDALTGQLPSEDKPAFIFGRLFHRLILQPETLVELPEVPAELINQRTGKPYGGDTQAMANWQAENPNAVILEPWMQTMRERMPDEVRSLIGHPGARKEQSIFQTTWGVQVKCRPDLWIPSENVIYDLKTIRQVTDMRPDSFSRACEREIANRAYWFSAAWYRAVVKAECNLPHEFRFIFVEKGPPYRWRIVSISRDYDSLGDQKVADVLDMISTGLGGDGWDDRDSVHHCAEVPDWLLGDCDPHENDEGGIDL